MQKEYNSGSSSSRSRSQSLCGWVVLVAKGRDKQMRRKSHQATPGMCQPLSSNSTVLPQILWPVQAKAEAPASEPAPLRKLLLHQLEPSEQQQFFSPSPAAEQCSGCSEQQQPSEQQWRRLQVPLRISRALSLRSKQSNNNITCSLH